MHKWFFSLYFFVFIKLLGFNNFHQICKFLAIISLILFLSLSLSVTVVWTQGFVLIRQASSCLSYASSSLHSGYIFWRWVSRIIYLDWPQTMMFPISVSISGTNHQGPLVSLFLWLWIYISPWYWQTGYQGCLLYKYFSFLWINFYWSVFRFTNLSLLFFILL
jgi:hypothetical protein